MRLCDLYFLTVTGTPSQHINPFSYNSIGKTPGVTVGWVNLIFVYIRISVNAHDLLNSWAFPYRATQSSHHGNIIIFMLQSFWRHISKLQMEALPWNIPDMYLGILGHRTVL